MWSKVSNPVLVRNIGITGTHMGLEFGVFCWLPGLLTFQGGWRSVFRVSVSRLNPCFSTCSSLGVAYTSECFPCKPGTYAAKQGSTFCKLCPANTYSNKGEASCHPCDSDKYSGNVWSGEELEWWVTTHRKESGGRATLLAKQNIINHKPFLFRCWEILANPHPPITPQK